MSLVEFAEKENNNFLEIRLNSSETLNALTEEMGDIIENKVKEIISTGKIYRAAILIGSGKAFSAGGNLEMLLTKTKLNPEQNKKIMLEFYRKFLSILNLPFPTVAAINGVAVGAGLALACACDFRFISNKATLGFGFSKIGLHPGMGITYFLPRIVGVPKTLEYLVASSTLDAEQSLNLGLVNYLFGADNFTDEVYLTCKKIFSNGPEATRQIINNLRFDQNELQKCLEKEATSQSINYSSAEFLEGVNSIIEKRKPLFSL